MTTRILLASGSPRRSKLLNQFNYTIEDVITSHAEEQLPEHHEVEEIVTDNAAVKGQDVAHKLRLAGKTYGADVVLLAADTLVVMGERVYPKPKDLAEAEEFMHQLGGCEHRVITGVYLENMGTGVQHRFYDTTFVRLKKMTRDEMYEVWEEVNPLDKAGAYGYQDSPRIVEDLRGSETNVIGLPMEKLAEELGRVLDAG